MGCLCACAHRWRFKVFYRTPNPVRAPKRPRLGGSLSTPCVHGAHGRTGTTQANGQMAQAVGGSSSVAAKHAAEVRKKLPIRRQCAVTATSARSAKSSATSHRPSACGVSSTSCIGRAVARARRRRTAARSRQRRRHQGGREGGGHKHNGSAARSGTAINWRFSRLADRPCGVVQRTTTACRASVRARTKAHQHRSHWRSRALRAPTATRHHRPTLKPTTRPS